MSDAAPAAADAPPKKSKKKLIILVAAVLLLGGGGGGGALFYMKQQAAAAAAAAEDGEDAPVAHAKAKAKDTHAKPTYVPLDPFVVNLADKESDRFAQIGITLQVDDSKVADEMKTYMPTLRNGILMILAHKSSEELLQRNGKEQLAEEVMRAAAKALGIELDGEDDGASNGDSAKKVSQDEDEEDSPKKPKKKKKKKKPVHNPITHVHYSNFIIQ
jgi:flagellar FliL protein